MPSRDRILFALCMLSCGVTSAVAGARIDVLATGFAQDRGHAIAKLFRPGDQVRGPGRWETRAPIVGGQAQLTFPDLPPGEYAVVVFHDENDNGQIDHSLLGLPVEALGFSNGFELGLFSGLPSFDKLRFTHGTEPQHLNITVK